MYAVSNCNYFCTPVFANSNAFNVRMEYRGKLIPIITSFSPILTICSNSSLELFVVSRRTLKALEFANNRSAKVITITDSIHSPMNLYSSCNLIADSDMASIVDSLVAPLSVINALVVALCMKKQKEVAGTLTMLEDIWDEYQV